MSWRILSNVTSKCSKGAGSADETRECMAQPWGVVGVQGFSSRWFGEGAQVLGLVDFQLIQFFWGEAKKETYTQKFVV